MTQKKWWNRQIQSTECLRTLGICLSVLFVLRCLLMRPEAGWIYYWFLLQFNFWAFVAIRGTLQLPESLPAFLYKTWKTLRVVAIAYICLLWFCKLFLLNIDVFGGRFIERNVFVAAETGDNGKLTLVAFLCYNPPNSAKRIDYDTGLLTETQALNQAVVTRRLSTVRHLFALGYYTGKMKTEIENALLISKSRGYSEITEYLNQQLRQ